MTVQSFTQAKATTFAKPSIQKILTWTAPAIAIPGLRYTQDTHLQRKELFIRDASTYSIGAGLFFAAEWLAKKLLDCGNMIQNLERRNLAAFMVGLTVNLLYAGIGAVRISKAFSKYQAKASKARIDPPIHTMQTNVFYTPVINAANFKPIYLQPHNLQMNTRMSALA